MDLQILPPEYIGFIIILGFIASFVDSIAGGGGLISLPGLLALGIPPVFALGTNKFAFSLAAFASSLTFVKYKVYDSNLLKYLIFGTLFSAILGVKAVLCLSNFQLKIIVTFLMIFVAIYMMLAKNTGNENNFEGVNKKTVIIGLVISTVLGFYDGFFGPGTGSFYIFSFITFLKYDFKTSAGNGRILNFISNITSLIMFMINKKVLYSIGIPLAFSMVIGGIIGARLAIEKGKNLIRPFLILVTLLYAFKMINDILR